MNLLPLNKLGARETAPGKLEFGILLPWVSAAQGNHLYLKIIHERDQFMQDIAPLEFELTHDIDSRYGDYWSTTVDVAATPPPALTSAWGQPGRYVYRYCLDHPHAGRIDWIIDPYAREFGVGKLSAITLGYVPHVWSAAEDAWRTPPLADLVIYELMVHEFGGSVEGAIDRLQYLADLGINCVEVMPVSNVSSTVDWGFLPIGYFGVDERFGKRRDFQAFVEAAHRRGIAVVVDSVYGHTAPEFPYAYLYRRLGYRENPFMGPFAKDYFGESTDFNRDFTRDFFFTVSHHWLEVYHIDGFRYDCVPNYWDGPMGRGYADLLYSTYEHVMPNINVGHWRRFDGGDGLALIQMAEQLEAPREILAQSYSNLTWQNGTLGAANACAHGAPGALASLGQSLGLMGYVEEATHNGERLKKSALQYIENHDHSRFVCNFGLVRREAGELLCEGDRGRWYKVQPYLIALLTAKGVPMLWQGQEFMENYYVPPEGLGRVMLLRPVRWDYFYDEQGRATISLVRRLLSLRRERAQFRRGDHFFYNDYHAYVSRGALLFSRSLGQAFSLVALNVTDQECSVPFAFPHDGRYREELHGEEDVVVQAGELKWLRLPSNYGRIWTWVGA